MTVSFKNFVLGGGSNTGATLNSFSDNFNRADNVNGYGSNWLVWDVGYFPTSFSQVNEMRIVGNRARIGGSNSNFSTNDVRVNCPAFLSQRLFVSAQFVECAFSFDNADVNSGLICGPAALQNWGTTTAVTNGYCMSASNGAIAGGNASVWRSSPYVFPNPVLLGVVQVAPLVPGDIMRMEAVPTLANTTLRCFINGVLTLTVVDAAAARSSFGWPCMVQELLTRTIPAINSAYQEFDNFSCGLL